MNAIEPDMEALKARLKTTWQSGDFGHFATYLLPGAMAFLERLGLWPGIRMLDVACGAGQIALPAAWAGAQVTGIDIASNLIAQARERAEAENLAIQFDEGDAEALPYKDGSFDLVVSLIGAMFAPQPERVAAELARVCKPGGRIVMANWMPEGFIGQMFEIMGRHVPPPAIMPSPIMWGDEVTARKRLRAGVTDFTAAKRSYPLRYPFSPTDVVEYYRMYYGPTNRAFAALDEKGQTALRGDLVALWLQHNRASDGATAVDSEYLEIFAIRAPSLARRPTNIPLLKCNS